LKLKGEFMSSGPEAGFEGPTEPSREHLTRVFEDWRVDEEDELPDREVLGSDIASRCGGTVHSFRHLQTLIVGEGTPLPYAPPCVRIVTSKEGWKEDYALVYGFPAAEGGQSAAQATRFPEAATLFRIYYGANYGSGGYKKVTEIRDVDPAILEPFNRGEFTDDEAEQLLAQQEREMDIYWELLLAARNPELNPAIAEQTTQAFYRHADQIGL
jgi:hypothetical protein